MELCLQAGCLISEAFRLKAGLHAFPLRGNLRLGIIASLKLCAVIRPGKLKQQLDNNLRWQYIYSSVHQAIIRSDKKPRGAFWGLTFCALI
jgi:hypothetical protein